MSLIITCSGINFLPKKYFTNIILALITLILCEGQTCGEHTWRSTSGHLASRMWFPGLVKAHAVYRSTGSHFLNR